MSSERPYDDDSYNAEAYDAEVPPPEAYDEAPQEEDGEVVKKKKKKKKKKKDGNDGGTDDEEVPSKKKKKKKKDVESGDDEEAPKKKKKKKKKKDVESGDNEEQPKKKKKKKKKDVESGDDDEVPKKKKKKKKKPENEDEDPHPPRVSRDIVEEEKAEEEIEVSYDSQDDNNHHDPKDRYHGHSRNHETSHSGYDHLSGSHPEHTDTSGSHSGGMGTSSKRHSRKRDKAKRMAQKIVQPVVPKMEPVPVHLFFLMSALVAVPTAIYILLFTKLGYGLDCFYYLAYNYGDEYASVAGAATAGLFLICYLLDVDTWTNHPGLQKLLGLAFVVGVTLMVLLMTGDYPYGPICLFAASTPLWLITCNNLNCFGRVRTRDFVNWLSAPLFAVSVITGITWLTWTFMGEFNEYNQVTKAAYAQATGCVPNLEEYPQCALSEAYNISTTATNNTTILDDWVAGVFNSTMPSTAPSSAPTTTPASFNTSMAADDWDDETDPNYDDDALPTTTMMNGTRRILHQLTPAQEATREDHYHEGTSFPAMITEEEAESNDSSSNSSSSKNIMAQHNLNNDGVCFLVVIEPEPTFVYDPAVCDPSCTTAVYDECLNAFILWAGPLLVAMVLFFLSFFCTFLRSSSSERDILNFGKLWLFLIFTMWLTASLAGVTAGLTSALMAMTLASFVGSVIFIAMTRSRTEGKEQAASVWKRVVENFGDYMDVARGLFIITLTPFIFIYLILSILNQMVRKLEWPCSKENKTPETQNDFLTKRARKQVRMFQSWDRAQVLTYAIYWGVAFMILQVIVAQFTVLFLSWLIEVTSTMNLAAVTFILVGVGMIMFLLPPVPGVPIYLTLGIVILAVGRDMMGVFGSIAYACAVSLALKLVACAVQQKLIGENLARYISIRKMVQINSMLIKGMRLILADPGMKIDKVCILVGGPDWPTSVLCGIMRLDLLPVLIGTLPVFLLILPTVLTGSFMFLAGVRLENGNLEFPSAPVLGTVFAAITAVVQFAAMILAAYYLEQTTSNRAEEIEAVPIDEPVAELERNEVHFNNCYTKVTQWDVVPGIAKFMLYLSYFAMVTCCYMVQLFSNLCFSDYELTYTIDANLDGNWLNLVKPFGWYAIILFAASCFLLSTFIAWATVSLKVALSGVAVNH